MSRIIDKAFDASRKIVRSIFKGSPNLITSADLNRQMEAFKYQLDQLDDKTGVLSDINITHNLSGSTLTVGWMVSYMKFKGCSFSISNPALHEFLSINLTASAPIAYMCLVADKRTVTYSDDATHDLAGAKFEDGTSMPAANQIIYENEQIVLTHALSSLGNLVGIIGVFQLSEDTGNVIFRSNFMPENNSLPMSGGGTISNFNKNLSGAVNNGKSYDEAFSILENRANNIVTDWTYLTNDYGKNTDISFRLQNGVMYLNMPAQKLNLFVPRMGGVLAYLGNFPSDIHDKLLSMFNSLYIPSYNKFNYGGDLGAQWVPYGDFGTFPVFSPYQAASEEPSVSEVYPRYGFAKVSLVVAKGSDADTFGGIGIAAYVDHYIQFTSDGKATYREGPVDWLSLQSPAGYIYTPRIFGVVPLPGKF